MKSLRVLNLGAGVQSTTVYLMACGNAEAARLGQPLPYPEVGIINVSIFADTQDEPQEVYRHLAWLQKKARRWPGKWWQRALDWIQKRRGPAILVRSKGKLSDDLKHGRNSTGGRFASIPAYTSPVEGMKATGAVRRQCSKEYKIEVIDRTIRREILSLKPRQRVPKDVHITQLFGISLDEAGRATRLYERIVENRWTWLTMEFPLIQMFFTRDHCIEWLCKFGNVPHEVPRSACVYCPFHSDPEWLRVKSNPADWKLAVETDEALRIPGNVVNRKLDQKLYLHRSCLPLVQIDFRSGPTETQRPLNFANECLGVCGV